MKNKSNVCKIIACILGILIGVASQVSAKHIIGGEMTYRYLNTNTNGSKNWEFKLKMYRDCSDPSGAPFDNSAPISIYERIGTSAYSIFTTVSVGITNQGSVAPPTNPCVVIPPGVCVERAEYVFTRTLPYNADGYTISYQRCCRNNNITNLINPGDQGATFTIDLSGLAQQGNNSSPVFKNFPPTVICAKERINFDHSASDADGDQIVYELCSPLQGGGMTGGGNCNAVTPNPACPPPYDNVVYKVPTYSAVNPIGGNPQIGIDANTGAITGEPQNIGQYVVGVCMSEYRNGVLLSVVRRDFQFNVTNCQAITAKIKSDKVIGEKEFFIKSCGSNSILFINESSTQLVTGYLWTFKINGKDTTYTSRDVSHTFPGVGTYFGSLILNPGTICSDTALIYIDIFPKVTSDFSFKYDTCVAGPVAFTDLSNSLSGPIQSWDWAFADTTTSQVRNPTHLYQNPGNFPVMLKVTDKNECSDSTTKSLKWFPVPPALIIEPSTFIGCQPASIFFNNLSSPIDTTYNIVWNFGDGKTSNKISPTHVYDTTGVFDISIFVTSPIGCKTDTFFQKYIKVEPSPTANFVYSPLNPSNFQPKIDFIDQSSGANQWYWKFDTTGVRFSRLQNPSFTFRDTGLQTVQLIVTHPQGCKDTLTRIIDVMPKITYYIPDAFTPNNDNKNEFFMGEGILEGIKNFKMLVWNRWGEQIFESNKPDFGWNGKKNNAGADAPEGVYVYTISFIGPREKTFTYQGYVTLLR